MLDIVASYCCKQFQGKLTNQTWENSKKPSSKPDFGLFLAQILSPKFFLWVLPLLDVIHSCKISLYAILGKTNEPKLRKSSFGSDFFSKIWLRQSLDIMVSYHHVQYQEKLMIQSWENLVTDRQTDGREWFYRTLSD